MARRVWTAVAITAAIVLLHVDAAPSSSSAGVSPTTYNTDTRITAGIETELQQLQQQYDDGDASSNVVTQLATTALDPTSTTAATTRALVELGDAFFYSNASLNARVNGTLAMQLYSRAALAGDAHAQFHVGVAHAYGFWGLARDEPAALLHYYYAALGDSTAASLALGSRHLLGVGTPKNCETAVRYYEVAANRAVALREAAPDKPAIYDLPHRRLKTVAESQHKKNTPSDAAIVDYYEFSADKGDADATMNLATLYYYGARGLTQDLPRAAALFQRAYDLGAAGSAYHLGHIYSHGIGVAASNATALQFLQEAAADGNTQALNELGAMHLHGRGLERDERQATALFQTAAKQGSMEAFYNLGVLHMQGRSTNPNASPSGRRGPEYEVAHGYFQVAAHQGHTISSHKLGHMSLHGIGTMRSCKSAADAFKLVGERGPWDRLMARAFQDFRDQDYAAAFNKYAVMAQQGLEVAQHNAAYLLDYGYLTPLFDSLLVATGALEAANASTIEPAPRDVQAAAAMSLYKLAALQGNVDANLKIGDFYYYGRGGHAVDMTRASAHYSLASKRANAQALFNLAYMYEHGVGVDQDFFLAKRFLDKAKDAHSDAYVPVTLALWKLKVHTWFVGWQRAYDIAVGNIEAPLAAPMPQARAPPTSPATAGQSSSSSSTSSGDEESTAAAAAGGSSQGFLDSLLDAWWPSLVSIADDVVYDVLESEDVLILLLLVALGIVLYIRSERQHMLGDPMPLQPQAQPQAQVPQAQELRAPQQ